jgi:hypothetical protein
MLLLASFKIVDNYQGMTPYNPSPKAENDAVLAIEMESYISPGGVSVLKDTVHLPPCDL